MEKRDVRFDNLKGFIIFLVVFAHAIEKMQISSMIITHCVYNVVYSFHIPVLIFISGFFSKNSLKTERKIENLIKTILIPFILAHLLMWSISSRSMDALFIPRWTLWYLLSLFFWRLLIVPFSKIRFAIIVSVIFSLLIGFSSADRLLAISRTIAFFPFFIIGYKTDADIINKIRKVNKIIPIMLFLFTCTFVVCLTLKGISSANFIMTDPYKVINKSNELEALFFRFVVLAIGFVNILCLLSIVTEKQTRITRLGQYTMPVYLGHPFVLTISYIIVSNAGVSILSNEFLVIVISIFLAVLNCIILGNSVSFAIYNKITQIASSVVINKDEQFNNSI